jgi:hypothetical protein
VSSLQPRLILRNNKKGRGNAAPLCNPRSAQPARYYYFFLLFAALLFSSTTACAAANREIGTRNGEALT